MNKKIKTVLELNHNEAKAFFLKSDKYFSSELPPYLKFDKLLEKLSEAIDSKKPFFDYEDEENFLDKPSNYEHNNYTIWVHKKTEKYSWRCYEFIHPVLYVYLVNQITEENNWKIIQKKFNNNTKDNLIECSSWPVDGETEDQIKNWKENFEKRSMGIGLQYDFFFKTDISDCYRSIYTHSIEWALVGRRIIKEKIKGESPLFSLAAKKLARSIDIFLMNINYGQTNGIPIGSILTDFIAEIILNHIDQELYEEIKNIEFKILRFRDDYRIFTKNEKDGKIILEKLAWILDKYGMNLNSDKTSSSKFEPTKLIKPDKLFSLTNIVPFWIYKSLYKQLLNIRQFANIHPCSGQLKKKLLKFYEKIYIDPKIKDNIKELIKKIKENIKEENVTIMIEKIETFIWKNNIEELAKENKKLIQKNKFFLQEENIELLTKQIKNLTRKKYIEKIIKKRKY